MKSEVTFALRALVVAVVPTLTASSAPAAEIHVALNGSDRNAGTEASPLRTLNGGLAAARPGDAVIVHAGVYSPSEQVVFPNAGREGRLISLQAAKDEEVVLDGGNTPADTDLIYVGTHHVRIRGLTVRNARRNGVVIWGPGRRVHHVEVVDNTIHDCERSAVFASCSSLEDPVRDLLIEGNAVHDVVLRNLGERRRTWDSGVCACVSKNVTIRGNTVTTTHGEAIGVCLSDGCTIEGNTVSDGYSVNVYLDNTTNTTVTRNLVFNTGRRSFNRFGQPASGIQIANERYPGLSNPSRGNVITNNVLIGGYHAFYYGSYQNGGGLRDTIVAHNTAFGSTGPLLHVDEDAHRNSVIANNVFVQDREAPITDVGGSTDGISFRSNLWFGGEPHPLTRSRDDLLADPLLRKPGTFVASDYQLRPGSPARGTAFEMDGVRVDFSDRPRTKASFGAWR